MNVQELTSQTSGTLAHYFATMIPLTAVTTYIFMALQHKSTVVPEGSSPIKRLLFPVYLAIHRIKEKRETMAKKKFVGEGIPRVSIAELLEDDEVLDDKKIVSHLEGMNGL